MKTGKLLLLVVLAFISCNRSRNIPPGILKPAQMQELLWDMIRGDILAQEVIKKDSTKTLEIQSLEISDKILAIHKIDRAKFENSMIFYEKHPALVKTIFDSLHAIKTRRPLIETEKRKLNTKEQRLTPPKNIKTR